MRCATAIRCVVGATLGGVSCGCDAYGSPALDLHLVNAASRAPLPLGGTRLVYETSIRVDEMQWSAADTVTAFRLFGPGGRWRLQVERTGFVAAESTVVVATRGYCERPVLRSLVMALQPLPQINGGPGA